MEAEVGDESEEEDDDGYGMSQEEAELSEDEGVVFVVALG